MSTEIPAQGNFANTVDTFRLNDHAKIIIKLKKQIYGYLNFLMNIMVVFIIREEIVTKLGFEPEMLVTTHMRQKSGDMHYYYFRQSLKG